MFSAAASTMLSLLHGASCRQMTFDSRQLVCRSRPTRCSSAADLVYNMWAVAHKVSRQHPIPTYSRK